LIDTGASVTAVDMDVLRRLGLPPVGTGTVVTPSGTETQGVYVVRLTFPQTPIPPLDPIPVMGSQLAGFGHIVLLGRDLLYGALLIYDGVHGHWTIAF
jgi:predicted aspartyl protease